ncbi:hypothetical protein BAUCODRAFT_218886 [Baudoinia panamericana UAMH 10762]|uniref:Uncharacterized protein n=1 Tax=Baudoinia panamericana (strain UAMH 10762) TaxID=717646 RepID=M2MRF1_BAUPA|nr:uncharacterized protein BAUCODRAFT_218886 [Baudoinia panamericana UAMH 10762]EMC94028.1 hypothetical protein BAUCODRAFT_218886 [Baudoinia panamericana UAMH 10762]
MRASFILRSSNHDIANSTHGDCSAYRPHESPTLLQSLARRCGFVLTVDGSVLSVGYKRTFTEGSQTTSWRLWIDLTIIRTRTNTTANIPRYYRAISHLGALPCITSTKPDNQHERHKPSDRARQQQVKLDRARRQNRQGEGAQRRDDGIGARLPEAFESGQ